MALKKSYTKTGKVYYAKQPENWVSKLKRKVKSYFAKEKQSKKEKEIRATRLSRQTQRQLSSIDKRDYEDVMKMLKGRK